MAETVFSIVIIVLVILLFILAVAIFRAVMYGKVPEPVQAEPGLAVEGPQVAEHLAAAIRIPTLPLDGEGGSPERFTQLWETLERLYPRLHATLRCEPINTHSRLYSWPGSGEGDPLLLYAHIDVVPADPATLEGWTHPPFSGAVEDGFVWGRGALDMKSIAITLMEAVERLIKDGMQPSRTVYLAVGHDEETGGLQGAAAIAEHLRQRGERLCAVIDEGGAMMTGLIDGLEPPAALVGVTEKGYATVELKVEGRSGHSSMPPRHTAIGVLSRAVTRVEAAPMPARLERIMAMMKALGAFLPFSTRLALANPWLLRGSLERRLSKSTATNAQIRTTTAVTIIQGGLKDNVLPAEARALVNFRLLPGDTPDGVVESVRRIVNDDAVQVNLLPQGGWLPAPVSDVDGQAYQAFSTAIRQTFADVVVAPYMVSGATDSRHFVDLTDSVFRFNPFYLNEALLNTIHGVDERISVEALEQMVQFYARVIQEFSA